MEIDKELNRKVEDATASGWNEEKNLPSDFKTIDTETPTTFQVSVDHLKANHQEEERLNNIAQVTMLDSEWWKATFNTWDNTWVAKGYDYFKYDAAFFREEDPSFKARWDEKSILSFMKDNDLALTDYNDIKAAKSLEHAVDLAELKKIDKERESEIRNALTDTERMVTSLVTSLADADIFIGGAGMVAAKTLARTDRYARNIARVTAASEVSTGAFIGSIDDDTSMGEAMLIAGIIGAVDYNIVTRLRSKDYETLGAAIAGAPTDTTLKLIEWKGAQIKSSVDELANYKNTLDAELLALEAKPLTRTVKRKAEKAEKKAAKNGAKAIDEEVAPVATDKLTEVQNKAKKMDNLLAELYKATPDNDKLIKLYDDIVDDIPVKAKSAEEMDTLKADIDVARASVAKLIDDGVEGKRLQKAQRLLTKLENKLNRGLAKTPEEFAAMGRLEVMAKEMERRMKLASSVIFKEIDEFMPKIKLDTNMLRLVRQYKQDIVDISSDIEMNIATIKKDLEAYAKSDVNLGAEILAVYQKMHKKGFISKSAYDQMAHAYTKGKGTAHKPPKIEVKSNGVGKDMDITINGKKVKKLPYVVGASLVATSAFSYDGTDIATDLSAIMLGSLLLIAGVANAKGIARLVTGFGTTMQTATARARTSGVRAKISETVDMSRTRLTETMKPLLDNTSGEVLDLVKSMYYNAVNTEKTVERIKNRLFHDADLKLKQATRGHFKEWLKESGSGRVEAALSLFTSNSKRHEFNKLVTDHIENGTHATSPSILKASESVNLALDKMMKEMRDAGVKDIDKTHILKNYVPRVMNRSKIGAILANAAPSSREAFILAFSKMLTKTPNADEVARVYINVMTDPLAGAGRKSLSSLADIKAVAAKHGFGDDVVDDLADALGIGGDKFNRLKNRIHMEKKAFPEVKIDYLDGNPSYTATLDDLFEHDIMNIMSDYLNKASGQVAFADMGYKSIDNAMEVVANSNIKPEYAKTIMNDIQALSGSPVIDYSDVLNSVMRNVSNMTIGIKMTFSTLSLASELAATLGKLDTSGWKGMLQSTVSGMRKTYGDDSFLMGSLAEKHTGTGLGMHQYGATFGAYKNLDEFGNITGGESSLNIMSKFSEVLRDTTLHVLPFVRFSDFLTKTNLQDSLQTLHKHATGKKVFKDYEKESFAITPRAEELFKRFEVNDKGYVKWMDFEKWSREDRTDFFTVVDSMMQKRIQQSTMGTTASWSRNSALGVAASTLIKFPMSAYSNIGSFLGRGMLAGDANAMTQTALWFGGSAMATMARHELKGQAYDENDIMIDAMLQHPFAGVYGTAMGVLNPAPTQTMADLQEAINIYNWK